MLRFDFVQSADSASDEHTIAIGIALCEINRRLSNGLVRSHQRELTETIDPPLILRIKLNMLTGPEVADLAAEPNLEVAAVKPLHEPHATPSGTYCFPDVVQIEAKRRHDAETCHYYSTT